MSPRPRKVSNDDVYAATFRAMNRVGPGDLTLGLIAEEAGVTAAALSQRFGSKRQLLLSLSKVAAQSSGSFLKELAAKHRSPLAAILDYAECMAHLAPSPAVLARNLAYLQIDLTDPDFREQLEIQARATRTELQELLRKAVSARELKAGTDVRRLARALEVTLSGSLLTWAFYQEGTAARWLRENAETLLAPYRTSRTRSAASRK
jgi:AcrR family transcriptional regulator